MCDFHSTVIATPPAGIAAELDRLNPTISLDACIAHAVGALWRRGVVTLGSCCGHGTARPSLVLNTDPAMPGRAQAALAEVDDRPWQLFQWQLVDVSELPVSIEQLVATYNAVHDDATKDAVPTPLSCRGSAVTPAFDTGVDRTFTYLRSVKP